MSLSGRLDEEWALCGLGGGAAPVPATVVETPYWYPPDQSFYSRPHYKLPPNSDTGRPKPGDGSVGSGATRSRWCAGASRRTTASGRCRLRVTEFSPIIGMPIGEVVVDTRPPAGQDVAGNP